MSLVTRIGASNSNSYVTLDQAELILQRMPDSMTEWDALTTTHKEFRLVLATQIMNGMAWRGKRVYLDQALCWPRTFWDITNERWRYEEDSRRIPDVVKEAQCLIAYSVVHRGLANRPAITEDIGQDVTSIYLVGLLQVVFGKGESKSALDSIMASANSIAYLKVGRYLSQFRGGAIGHPDDDDYWEPYADGLPTTTTTTTTTSSSTTSTSTTTTTTAP